VINIFMTITNVKTLRDRLIHARELRALTQAELAKKSHCAQSAIGNVESGTRQSLKNIVLVARALGVSVDWLYDGKGPKPALSNTLVGDLNAKIKYKTSDEFESGLAHVNEVNKLPTQKFDPRTLEVIDIMTKLDESQKAAALARLREFVNYLDAPKLDKLHI
jgi:transcriptional regulator with XRE-family HTH domain